MKLYAHRLYIRNAPDLFEKEIDQILRGVEQTLIQSSKTLLEEEKRLQNDHQKNTSENNPWAG